MLSAQAAMLDLEQPTVTDIADSPAWEHISKQLHGKQWDALLTSPPCNTCSLRRKRHVVESSCLPTVSVDRESDVQRGTLLALRAAASARICNIWHPMDRRDSAHGRRTAVRLHVA